MEEPPVGVGVAVEESEREDAEGEAICEGTTLDCFVDEVEGDTAGAAGAAGARPAPLPSTLPPPIVRLDMAWRSSHEEERARTPATRGGRRGGRCAVQQRRGSRPGGRSQGSLGGRITSATRALPVHIIEYARCDSLTFERKIIAAEYFPSALLGYLPYLFVATSRHHCSHKRASRHCLVFVLTLQHLPSDSRFCSGLSCHRSSLCPRSNSLDA